MKEYRKIVSVHPAILYKDDLIELQKVLNEGLSPKEGDLSVVIGIEDAKLRANSFEELFAQLLPNQVDDLSISANGRQDGIGTTKNISLDFYHNHIQYYISGTDETWFLGMISQLKNFFAKRKPWYAWLNKALPFLIGALIWPSILVAIWGFVANLPWAGFLASTFFVSIIVIGWLGFKQKLFPYVRIFFSQRSKQKLSYEVLVIILNLAILIATLASIVIPLVASKK